MENNKKTAYIRGFIILISLLVAITGISFAISTLEEEEEPEMVNLEVVTERYLIPGGQSIGVKMDVKGVLVVGLEEIETITGERVNPGLMCGLQIGDTIVEINDQKVYRAKEVQKLVNDIKGDIALKIMRKDEIKEVHLTPVIAKEDKMYKLGVWVKDKTAGIGTLTFYDPETKQYGALGHAITDPETGAVLSVAEGELVNSKVESVKQGKAGEPGEIRGIFYEAEAPLGTLDKNSEQGIFGKIYEDISNPMFEKPIPIGKKDTIKEGPALILTTLDNNEIESYEIEIEKINVHDKDSNKNMTIKVTDDRLLEASGGIVQGMSGSPIIQDGKLVGAVTHVLVNDPTRGYGIFIENMLEAAK